MKHSWSTRPSPLVLIVAVLLAKTSLLAQVGVTNVGLEAAGGFQLQGNFVAFRVNEFQQGRTDLNGDGDVGDPVLHLYNATTGAVTNVGLDASFQFQLRGNLVAFLVSELRQGNTDLNGDGDTNDVVLHVFNVSTGAVTNLGLAAGGIQMNGNLVAFGVGESGQGNTDLNGDGDTNDFVLHLFDVTTGTTTNLGHAVVGQYRLDDNLLAFVVDESRQGSTDLNGDGDTNDQVVHLFDATTGSTTNLGLATRLVTFVVGAQSFELRGGLLAFRVWESAQGNTDFNGDGDTIFDSVLHLFDASTGRLINLELDAVFGFQFGGTLLAFGVSEPLQGRSQLNGDDDGDDVVIHVYNTATESTTNLGLSLDSLNRMPFSWPHIRVQGNLVAFRVSEFEQGRTDLNGDGLIRRIMSVFNAVDGTTTHLGINTAFRNQFAVQGDFVALQVHEFAQANTDLNGDGDTKDQVYHLYDSTTATTTNLGLAGLSNALGMVLQGNLSAFPVNEFSQGGTDLNGDGNIFGRVLHLFDASTGALANLRLSIFFRPQMDENLLAFRVFERGPGGDLNGDADSDDVVLHVANVTAAIVPGFIENLIADVLALNLPVGIENSLLAMLNAALQVTEDANQNSNLAAINQLEAFITNVEQRNQIPEPDADALIAGAQDIIARLNGG